MFEINKKEWNWRKSADIYNGLLCLEQLNIVSICAIVLLKKDEVKFINNRKRLSGYFEMRT